MRPCSNHVVVPCSKILQTGFAMLEAGLVKSKNTQNVLLKNVMDASIGAICWYLLGYGLAHGDGGSAPSFIGTDSFALKVRLALLSWRSLL